MSDRIEKVFGTVLEDIRHYSPEDYAKIEADPSIKARLIAAARATAIECMELSTEFDSQPQDIAVRLAKYLSVDRIQLIEGALRIPTFRLDFVEKPAGKHWAEFTREGRPFLPPRALETSRDIDWTKLMQYGSILVEAVMLVMAAVGISITINESVIKGTVEEVAQAIQSSSKLERAVEAFIEAWNAAGAGAYAKARAVFHLIKDSYTGGILWVIIKSLCSHMHWYEWIETAAKVLSMIVAALATDGMALIAEIALIVLSALDFAKKIVNIATLDFLKETL